MAQDAAVRIQFNGDASQFKRTLQQIEDDLSNFRTQLKTATGDDITNITFKIKGLEEQKRALQTFGYFAENTLGRFQQELRDLQQQRLEVDISQIPIIDAKIEELTDRIAQANSQFDNIGDASKRARTALTSLNLIVQDLPFGFIAIQNNLPALIQQFGLLQTESKGIKGAFSELVKSLNGPAGLFLAFSVVTTGVTFLIQKYGSLGNAISALTNTQSQYQVQIDKLSKSFQDYSENLKSVEDFNNQITASESGRIAKANALTNIVTNLSNAESLRSNALSQLKDLDKDYYENITTAATDVDKLKKATQEYTQALIANSYVKAYENEITRIKQLQVEQDSLTQKLQLELSDRKKLEKSALDQTAATAKLGPGAVGAGAAIFSLSKKIINTNTALIESKRQSKEYGDTLSNLIIELQKATLEASKFYKTNTDGPKEIAGAKDDVAELIQEFIKIKKAPPIFDSLVKTLDLFTKETRIPTLLDQLFSQEQFNEITNRIKNFTNKTGISFDEFRQNLINKLILEQAKKGFALELQDIQNILNNAISSLNASVEELSLTELEESLKNTKFSLKSLSEVYDLTFADIVKRNKEIRDSIQSFLFQPLENLFDALLKGENSWKDFGNAVIGVIKRIAAQLAALAITKTLANLIAPGLGSISTKALESFLSATPDFDFAANISGGGLGLTGQVVMVQRGTDLIGVINRTNATINRVG